MLNGASITRALLGALTLAAVGLAGRAEAGCDADGNPSPAGSPCYVLKGSDTLFDIMTTAINLGATGSVHLNNLNQDLTTTPVSNGANLFYAGTGSGNAETAMRTATSTGIGVQSIGPMSRNFRPSVIDPLSPDFTPRSATALTASGHAAWAPVGANVVGLDAAVFVAKNGVVLDNVDFTTFVDASVPTAFKKGNINNASLAAAFGNGNGFGNLTAACTACGQSGQPACPASCVNYNNLMSVVLSGVDGSGTLAACADPRRVQAVQDLAGLLGVTTLGHVFRRDDNSGTTDTFKDRIMVVRNSGAIASRYVYTGGRFCNGTAVGQISGAAPQQGVCSNNRGQRCFVNRDCGTPNLPPSCTAGAGSNQCVYCQYNLNNQDFDPIRRPCSPSGSSAAPSSCTDMTTGQPCQFGDGNANCTQGLVVALSDADPGSPDVTVSIGKRVGTSDGSLMGYAGREAALNTGAKALRINNIKSSDENVRNSNYLLARRLFIQNTFANSTDANDVPTDNQTANSVTGQGASQLAVEQALWTAVLSNRALMDPIVRNFNFIRCGSANDGDDPSLESNNLCSITPAAPVPGALGAYTPSGAFGGGTCNNNQAISCTVGNNTPCGTGTCTANANAGGAKSINSAGRVWTSAGLAQASSSAGALCASGLACPSSAPLVCPDAALRPANAPCTVGSDCQSGVCADLFSHSTGGRDGLYCQ